MVKTWKKNTTTLTNIEYVIYDIIKIHIGMLYERLHGLPITEIGKVSY